MTACVSVSHRQTAIHREGVVPCTHANKLSYLSLVPGHGGAGGKTGTYLKREEKIIIRFEKLNTNKYERILVRNRSNTKQGIQTTTFLRGKEPLETAFVSPSSNAYYLRKSDESAGGQRDGSSSSSRKDLGRASHGNCVM